MSALRPVSRSDRCPRSDREARKPEEEPRAASIPVELAISDCAILDQARADGQPRLKNLKPWRQIQATIWLFERGSHSNIADEKSWTAVHQAASRGKDREGNTRDSESDLVRLHLAAAFHGLPHRDFIGIFQVAAHRDAHCDASYPQP